MRQVFEARRDHYREIAIVVRLLARQSKFPTIRRQLIDIANRYDRMADFADSLVDGGRGRHTERDLRRSRVQSSPRVARIPHDPF
jgi:hypothetical protein